MHAIRETADLRERRRDAGARPRPRRRQLRGDEAAEELGRHQADQEGRRDRRQGEEAHPDRQEHQPQEARDGPGGEDGRQRDHRRSLRPSSRFAWSAAAGQPPFLDGTINFPPKEGVNIPPGRLLQGPRGNRPPRRDGENRANGENPIEGLLFQLPPGYRPAAGRDLVFPNVEDEETISVLGSNVVSNGHNLEGDVVANGGKGTIVEPERRSLSGPKAEPAPSLSAGWIWGPARRQRRPRGQTVSEARVMTAKHVVAGGASEVLGAGAGPEHEPVRRRRAAPPG